MATIIRALGKLHIPRAAILNKHANRTALSHASRTFSTGMKDGPPENFYDDKLERDKEFADITASIMSKGGLESLVFMRQPAPSHSIVDDTIASTDPAVIMEAIKTTGSLNQRTEKDTDIFDLLFPNTSDEERLKKTQQEIGEARDSYLTQQKRFTDSPQSRTQTAAYARANSDADLGDHLQGFRGANYIPQAALNYNLPWRKKTEPINPQIKSFLKPSAPELYRYDKQGLRSCDGKKQRRGRNPNLSCHLIDLDSLNHFDVLTLKRFVCDDGEILNRKLSGLCARCQRQVAGAIKRARHMGIIPHLGQVALIDSKPKHDETQILHTPVAGSDPFVSKTVF